MVQRQPRTHLPGVAFDTDFIHIVMHHSLYFYHKWPTINFCYDELMTKMMFSIFQASITV